MLNAGEWYDPKVQADHAVALQLTKSTAFDIRTRSQAVDPTYVKMAWPYKSRGNKPFLMILKRNGKPMHRLFMLAASKEVRSELDSEVTESLALNNHAYKMMWDYVLEKRNGPTRMSDILRIVTRMGRQADVGVIYCQRMEDTLTGKVPVIPEFMAGHKLLNAVNDCEKCEGFQEAELLPSPIMSMMAATTGRNEQELWDIDTAMLRVDMELSAQNVISTSSHSFHINHCQVASSLPALRPPSSSINAEEQTAKVEVGRNSFLRLHGLCSGNTAGTRGRCLQSARMASSSQRDSKTGHQGGKHQQVASSS